MEERVVGHWVESVDVRGWSFGSEDEGAWREREWTLLIVGRERRVERIWEPCT